MGIGEKEVGRANLTGLEWFDAAGVASATARPSLCEDSQANGCERWRLKPNKNEDSALPDASAQNQNQIFCKNLVPLARLERALR